MVHIFHEGCLHKPAYCFFSKTLKRRRIHGKWKTFKFHYFFYKRFRKLMLYVYRLAMQTGKKASSKFELLPKSKLNIHFSRNCFGLNKKVSQAILSLSGSKAQPGGAEGAQAPPLAIRILMFIFLVFHQHCKSRSGALQNILWQYHKA